MFTEANVRFGSEYLVAVDENRKNEIRRKLYVLVEEMIEQLALRSLEKVVIKSQILFDSNLGTAYADKTIKLSFSVASTLADGIDRCHPEKYMDALATLYHEGYHISDYQKVMKKLLNPSLTMENGYKIWTEFFAVYSTYSICEQDHQYSSFESVFSKYPKDEEECRYCTSHLMGYLLHNEHSSECDRLINRFLNTKHIKETEKHLREMLEKYPNISINDLNILKELFDKLLCDKIDLTDLREISQEDYMKMLRNRSKI